MYAVFSNEQLAEMVRRGVESAAALGAIEGVGPARVERYGAAVLERLRQSGLNMPVIVLTADTQTTTRQTLIAGGAAEVLPKPPQADRLLQALEKLL